MNNSRPLQQTPKRIKTNLIDRTFIIPETNNLCGTHFPMSLVAAATLKQPVRKDELLRALHLLARSVPELRLGYALDLKRNLWTRVEDAALEGYLESLVQVDSAEPARDEVLSATIRTNTPLPLPLSIHIHGRLLCFKMHHSFGDGRFHFRLMNYLLTALYLPDKLDSVPRVQGYGFPLWRLVYRTPRQAASILGRGLSYFIKAQFGLGEPLALPPLEYQIEPVTSGSPMCVVTKTIPQATIVMLNQLRAALSDTLKITLNTLLQVLVAERLIELERLQPPVLFSIPVSLYRYLNSDEIVMHPGNLALRLRVKGYEPDADFRAACIKLQREVDQQLADGAPLVTIPSEWIMALNPNTYKHLNRHWLLDPQIVNKDPRFYNLTNLGDWSDEYAHLASFVDLEAGVFSAVPLMGRPPLVLSFNSVAHQGNLVVTYNPAVLSARDIDKLLQVFDAEQVSTRLQALSRS